jgi:hypothetical protein
MINSATDHGYNTDWSIRVHPGLICRCVVAHAGVFQTYRVTDRWAPQGFWKVVMLDGPEAGCLFDISEHRILEDAYAS